MLMNKLIEKLNFYGNVEVIRNDFVFTLLLTKKQNGLSLSAGQIPLKVLEVVINFIGSEKPNIEVMKNEENFLLIILKP